MTTALRPLSTSELLDRSFSLYRNNFILFAGIAILPALLKLILDLVQISVFSGSPQVTLAGINAASRVTSGSGSNILLTILYLLGVVIASGATVYAVSMVYLGKTATIAGSYSGIGPYLLRLIGIFLLMGLIIGGLAIAVIGVPVAMAGMARSPVLVFLFMITGILILVHLYVCLSVATAVCVVEKAGATASLNRSMKLTKGARGKIWLILLLMGVLELALGFALGVPIGIIAYKTGSLFVAMMLLSLAQFFVNVLVAPILTVPLVLIYYDQRVRKEAFDLQLMMESLGQTLPGQAASAAPIG